MFFSLGRGEKDQHQDIVNDCTHTDEYTTILNYIKILSDSIGRELHK